MPIISESGDSTSTPTNNDDQLNITTEVSNAPPGVVTTFGPQQNYNNGVLVSTTPSNIDSSANNDDQLNITTEVSNAPPGVVTTFGPQQNYNNGVLTSIAENKVSDPRGDAMKKQSYALTSETKTIGKHTYVKDNQGQWVSVDEKFNTKPVDINDSSLINLGVEPTIDYGFVGASPTGVRIKSRRGTSDVGISFNGDYVAAGDYGEMLLSRGMAVNAIATDYLKKSQTVQDNEVLVGGSDANQGPIIDNGSSVVMEEHVYTDNYGKNQIVKLANLSKDFPAEYRPGFSGGVPVWSENKILSFGSYDNKTGKFIVSVPLEGVMPGIKPGAYGSIESFHLSDLGFGKHTSSKLQPTNPSGEYLEMGMLDPSIIKQFNLGNIGAGKTATDTGGVNWVSKNLLDPFANFWDTGMTRATSAFSKNSLITSILPGLKPLSKDYDGNVPQWAFTDIGAGPSNTAKMTGGLIQYGSEVLSAGKNNGVNSAMGIASVGAAAGVGAFVTGFSQDPLRGTYNIGLGVATGKALGIGVPIPKGSSIKTFLTSSPGEMITGSIRSNKALGKLGISENGASRAGSIDIYAADMENALRPKGENTIGISPVKGIKSKDVLKPGDISITPINNPLRGDTFYYPTTKNYLAGRPGAIPKGTLDYYFEKVSIEPNGKTATLTGEGAFWTKNYKVKTEVDPLTAPKISEEEFMSIEEPTGGYPNVGVEARDLGITIERRKGSKYSQLEFEDKMKNWNKFYSGAPMEELLLNRVAPKVKTIIEANPEISSLAGRGRPFSMALGMANVNSMRHLQKNDVFQGQSMIMENKPKSNQNLLNMQISGLKNNQRLDTQQNNDNKLSWSYLMGQSQNQATKTTLKTGTRTKGFNTTPVLPTPTRRSAKVLGFGGNLGGTSKNPFSFGSSSKRWKNFGIMSDYISTPKRTTKKRRHH